jgi:hypothetical protein
VSVLLRQAGGFEGFCAIKEVLLPDNQSSAYREEVKAQLVDRDTASRSMPAPPDRDEKAVPEVEKFLRVESNVLDGFEQNSPNLTVAVMAVVDRVEAGRKWNGVNLEVSIKANYLQVEVAPIRRRVSLPYGTREDRSTQARVSGQSAPRGRQPPGERREAHDDPLIQAPARPRFRYERDSHTSDGIHILLRHRPRSIPQGEGAREGLVSRGTAEQQTARAQEFQKNGT